MRSGCSALDAGGSSGTSSRTLRQRERQGAHTVNEVAQHGGPPSLVIGTREVGQKWATPFTATWRWAERNLVEACTLIVRTGRAGAPTRTARTQLDGAIGAEDPGAEEAGSDAGVGIGAKVERAEEVGR